MIRVIPAKRKIKMKRILTLCAAAIVMAQCPVSASETKVESKQDSIVTNLNGVEIIANRATNKTPIAFTNLSKKDITKVNDGRDITFMIQNTPGVVVSGDAGPGIGYSSIHVRGTDPSRVNITANGVPINDSESSVVWWVNMPDLSSSLRNIQIQRGVGTSTNGAGAFGASINMLTDYPSSTPAAELTTGLGSFGTNRQTVKVSSGLFGDHWSLDARLSHIGSDGYIERASSRLWGYSAQLAYIANATSLRLLAFGGKERTYMAWDYASKEEMEKYGRRYNPCGKYTDSNGNTAYYPDQYDNFTQHHFQLIMNHSFSNQLRLNVTGHYTIDDGYYNQYKTNRTLAEYGLKPFIDSDGNKVKKSDLIRYKFNQNDFGGALINLNYTSSNINIIGGGALNWFFGDHFGQIAWVRNYIGPIDPLQKYYSNQGRKFDGNIFLRSDYSFNNSLSGYLDLQYRNINYSIRGISDNYDWNTESGARLDVMRTYHFFNPKAGLNYSANGHRLYASVSVAHKEPVRSNFTDADPKHYPNAERLIDYEAGWSLETKPLSLGIGLYYMDYKDQLVLTGQLSDTGNPLSVNVPNSYRAGIELSGAYRPTNCFEWSANATLSKNRIKNFVEYVYEDEWTNPIKIDCGDTPISFSPAVIFNNIFNFNMKGFDASFVTRYISDQYMNNAASESAKLDAYCVSDLSLGYSFNRIQGMKSLRLSATIYNIFNEKYCNNGYAGAGYTIGKDSKPEIYRYAGFSAQATTNVMTSITMTF